MNGYNVLGILVLLSNFGFFAGSVILTPIYIYGFLLLLVGICIGIWLLYFKTKDEIEKDDKIRELEYRLQKLEPRNVNVGDKYYSSFYLKDCATHNITIVKLEPKTEKEDN